jgi:SAM-dependent methyltransferase
MLKSTNDGQADWDSPKDESRMSPTEPGKNWLLFWNARRAQFEALRHEFDGFRADITGLAAEMRGLQLSVKDVQSDIAAGHQSGIERLSSKLDQIAMAQQKLARDAEHRFEALSADLEGRLAKRLDGAFAGFNDRLQQLEPLTQTVEGLRVDLEEHLDARLNDVVSKHFAGFHNQVQRLITIAERAEDGISRTGEIRPLLERLATEVPNLVAHLETSLQSRLNSFENDYLVDFRNRAQQLAATTRRAAEAANAASESKLMLEKLATELPNAMAHLDSSLNSRLNGIENDHLMGFASRLQELMAGVELAQQSANLAGESKLGVERLATEVPNLVAHLETSLQSRLNSFENDYLVDFRNRTQRLGTVATGAAEAASAARDAKLMLEKLATELPNAMAHLDSSLNSRLNGIENDHLMGFASRLQELMAGVELAQQAANLAGENKLGLERLAIEVPNVVAHLDTSLHSRLNGIENEYLVDLRNWAQRLGSDVTRAVEGVSAAGDAKLLLEKLSTELPNAVAHLDSSLNSRLNGIENEHLMGFSARLHELAAGVELAQRIANMAGEQRIDLTSAKLLIEKLAIEVPNGLIHLSTDINSRLNAIDNVVRELDGRMNSRLNKMENEEFPAFSQQIHEVAAIGLRSRAERRDRSAWRPLPDEEYGSPAIEPFKASLARARKDFPKVYRWWSERLDATRSAFDETMIGNAANAVDLYSRMFRSFVECHIEGRVLDVGCGVFGRPYYLQSYPAELISGLEPLPMKQAADFELIQGISEYLPWPSGSFSTVISATSLDHCISLDRSLAEMVRILKPGGALLLWIGSNPNSPPYRPDDPNFRPADQFHLFHFDTAWFEPVLEKVGQIVDKLEFRRANYSHVFYHLRHS